MHAALLTILVVAGAHPPVQAVVGQSAAAAGSSEGRSWFSDWFGPMPQTCYDPRFGCYSGASRRIQRYPAFHGHYYRAPYNYRHYYEYPWHASPHDPQAFFSHGTSIEGQEMIVPTPQLEVAPPATPVPTPAAPASTSQESQARRHTYIRATSVR